MKTTDATTATVLRALTIKALAELADNDRSISGLLTPDGEVTFIDAELLRKVARA
jgi:hypothetical protein